MSLILFFVISGLFEISAYKIPEVKFEIRQPGFHISVPDETGITEVFYVIEINELCSTIMDYLSKPEYGVWSARQQNVTLKNKDRITITLMVVHNDSIYLAAEHIEIKDNQPIKLAISNKKDDNLASLISICSTDHTFDPTSCPNPQTISPNVNFKCVNDLIFEETFDDTEELNQVRWNYDIYNKYNNKVDLEFVVFDNSMSNSFIKDGFLNIVPTITPQISNQVMDLTKRCTSYERLECYIESSTLGPYLPALQSAQINTKKSFTFQYGRIDIRAKLPVGNWLLPYILLKPIRAKHSFEVQDPQIRIAFARGNEKLPEKCCGNDIGGKHLYGGVVVWKNGVRIENFKEMTGTQHFGKAFHDYSLTWTNQNISMTVDGNNYGTIVDQIEYFNEPCYISVGVSAGGFYEYGNHENLPWGDLDPKANYNFWNQSNTWRNSWENNGALQIDYIRVYAI